MSDQQEHLSNLLTQRQTLLSEISELNSQAAAKRELMLRASGAIEYLQQIGVKLPEAEAAPKEGEEEIPTPETEVVPEPTPEA